MQCSSLPSLRAHCVCYTARSLQVWLSFAQFEYSNRDMDGAVALYEEAEGHFRETAQALSNQSFYPTSLCTATLPFHCDHPRTRAVLPGILIGRLAFAERGTLPRFGELAGNGGRRGRLLPHRGRQEANAD